MSSQGKAILQWQDPATDGGFTITNYRIYRARDIGNITVIATVGDVRTWTDANVTMNSSYYYYVSAVNEYGEGPRSSQVVIRPMLERPPDLSWIWQCVFIGLGVLGTAILVRCYRRSRTPPKAKHGSGSRVRATVPKNDAVTAGRSRQTVAEPMTSIQVPAEAIFKKTAAQKRAAKQLAKPAVQRQIPRIDGVPSSVHLARTGSTQPKDKSGHAQKATDTGTLVNRTVLKEYIERQRKEGVRELHYLKIKNDLNIISQKKSRKLYRILQDLVDDEILVRKGSNYVIVG